MVDPPSAQAILDQLKRARIEFITSLPDRMTSRLVELAALDPSFRVIPVCKEDEGVSICSAMSFSDRRAVLVTQHTGVLDSVNSLRTVAAEFGHPLVMIVGLLTKEPGVRPIESARVGIRIMEPLLDLLGISYVIVENAGDEAQIAELIEDAYSKPKPVAVLIGRAVL